MLSEFPVWSYIFLQIWGSHSGVARFMFWVVTCTFSLSLHSKWLRGPASFYPKLLTAYAGGCCGQAIELSVHLHQVLMLVMYGAIPVFMVQYTNTVTALPTAITKLLLLTWEDVSCDKETKRMHDFCPLMSQAAFIIHCFSFVGRIR